jgi:hypothetical protein
MESSCGDTRDEPECLCPCGCGCQNGPGGMDLPFYDEKGVPIPTGDFGYCASCQIGMHEIPPQSSEELVQLANRHMDVVRQIKQVANRRRNENTQLTFAFAEE